MCVSVCVYTLTVPQWVPFCSPPVHRQYNGAGRRGGEGGGRLNSNINFFSSSPMFIANNARCIFFIFKYYMRGTSTQATTSLCHDLSYICFLVTAPPGFFFFKTPRAALAFIYTVASFYFNPGDGSAHMRYMRAEIRKQVRPWSP